MKNFALPVVSFFLACIGATPLAVAQARPHLTQSSGGVTDPVVNDTWKGGTGNWSAAANWSAGVPNNGTPSGTTYNVFIDGGNPAKSAVTLDISAAINTLTVDSDDALTLSNNTSLTVNGPTITNHGAIHMNGGANANGFLTLGGNVTLSGTGTLTMSDLTGGGDAVLQGNGTVLTNQSTIQGTGIIGNGTLAIVNSGTIDANTSTGKGALTLNGSGGITNTGLLEATGGGALTINTTVIAAGGNITASGAGSSVNFNNATIQGGTLNSSAAGVLQTLVGTTAALDGSTHGAITISAGSTYTASNNSTTDLLGTITDKGVLQLNGGANLNGFLNISSSTVTLNGGGVLAMSDAPGGGDAVLQGNGAKLINQDTIRGTGIIGNGSLTVVNSGTIAATSGGKGALTLNGSGGITNTGLLEATSGGALTLNTTVNNASGNVTAGAVSSVNLNNATIQGGTLNNSAGGTLQTVAGTTAVLDGSTAGALTLSAGSTYTASNNSATNLLGTFTDKGLLQMNGGANANGFVNISSSTVTLNGGGVLAMSDAAGGGDAVLQGNGSTLINQDTIRGSGIIGNGSLAVVNSATIDATSGGKGALTLNGSGGVTNTGLLQATGGGALTINTTIIGTGGNITASGTGSSVNLSNSTIRGGTLNSSAGGVLQTVVGTTAVLDGSTTAGAVTISAGSTYTANNNASTNLLGTITDKGVLQLNGGANANGFLNISSATATLNGGGVVAMSDATGGGDAVLQGNGEKLVNQDTIRGTGIIGNGSLTVVNSGTIEALAGGKGALTLNGSGGLTNNGALEAAGGLLHVTGGPFTNFSGHTLTGGTYSASTTLEIDELGITGGEIVTNAANIILNGPSAGFVDGAGKDAVADLAANTAAGSFAITGGRNFTTVGNFDNLGSLTVGSGSKFGVHGKLLNFSGTTLTGGTYHVSGTLQFNGANIVTNAANITLTGPASKIINSTNSANALANFATNASTGSFSLQATRAFTTIGNFANAGALTIGAGSTFALGGVGNFTQTAGRVTDDGTLSTSGSVSLSGGSLFGKGLIKGALQSSGVITPGDSATSAGILTDSGSFKQNTGGSLDISIGGTTAGSKFDQLNSTTASLAGTLNIKLVNGFVPTLGTAFKVLNFGSATGKFTTVNGLAINSSEHFAVTYQATDVLLTVMSGPAGAKTAVIPPARVERSSSTWASSGLPSAGISSLPQTSVSARLGLSLGAVSTHAFSAVSAAPPRPRANSHGRIGSKGASGTVQFSLLHPLAMPAFFLAVE